ncbi:unannotated protein [freshwater metagenome]|uniref:Unannotated protein n=1 Tax=freshwater metagenome TaxID=449393 RepID=A0A6J7FP91_9ZZZZ|nr:1,4-dihydroxy-2-naphthoate polyprenyltransferase [Actinomycetota bacterium]MSW23344.1 1,4-dihydroxy-2-naphthoate polyprenyltransferase [Actinomycetota bacterium]MSW75226.1 1,4-dihydroxy-2-naphthoate polyprenyltransferase [Actinomycetota bacterium]MSY30414.1 1,4-dihydroxy-2-naphthoate polyprenyltransferase [Actinomycetota bacterium]
MTSLSTWLLGARPKTLPAAVAPVLVATALAKSGARPLMALLALIVSLALQVAVNYANDYSDGVRGSDTDRIGPTRLVASGLASAQSVKQAALFSFFIAGLVGLTLAFLTSWWLIVVGAISIAAAWAYTGGKSPYGYNGYGEISVFIFFGLVATMGSFYVQTQTITLKSFLVAVPIGCIACAILAVNNLRDREKDAQVGKRTLAVRLGDRSSRNFYIGLLVLAELVALVIFLPMSLITLASLPLMYSLIRGVNQGAQGQALIPVLVKTGQLQLLFSLLFSIALWLS